MLLPKSAQTSPRVCHAAGVGGQFVQVVCRKHAGGLNSLERRLYQVGNRAQVFIHFVKRTDHAVD